MQISTLGNYAQQLNLFRQQKWKEIIWLKMISLNLPISILHWVGMKPSLIQ
jgi:hypothetical protein